MMRGKLAAVVVAMLGVGTGVNLMSDTAPSVPARTVKVMSWNACANNSQCQYYDNPTGLVDAAVYHMRNNGAPADAAIFQEICASHASSLETALEAAYDSGWDVRFAPVKVTRAVSSGTELVEKNCAQGRGKYGIAIAVPDENTWWEPRYLPSPVEVGDETRVAMCATVDSWWVKICNAHFSYGDKKVGDDRTYKFREDQVEAYKSFVWPSRFRVVFGGDLNLRPPAEQTPDGQRLDPIYDDFVECAQVDTASPRTGPGTHFRGTEDENTVRYNVYSGHDLPRIDYLFTNADLVHDCQDGARTLSSDHIPLFMTVHLPAT